MKNLTYKKAGVDIGRADDFKSGIKALVRKSFRPEALRDIGGFGAFFSLGGAKYKEPVLVSSSVQKEITSPLTIVAWTGLDMVKVRPTADKIKKLNKKNLHL